VARQRFQPSSSANWSFQQNERGQWRGVYSSARQRTGWCDTLQEADAAAAWLESRMAETIS
jgi:hypothetical protein